MWHQKAKGPPDGPPIFLIFVEKLNCPQSQAYQSISPVGTGLSLTDRALGVSLGTSIGNYSPLIAPQPVKLKIRWWQHRVGSSPTTGTTSEWTMLHSKSPASWPGFSHTAPSFLLFPTKLCCANFRGSPALRAEEKSGYPFYHANSASETAWESHSRAVLFLQQHTL